MQIIDYICQHPWAVFGILSGLGVWFNRNDRDAMIICFLASLSVSLGIIIQMSASYFISEHLTYSLYAISDALLAFGVYKVAQRNKRYHAVTLLFFISILTHFTFQFHLLVKSPMLSGDYFAIMVSLNSLIIFVLVILSGGFRDSCRFFLVMYDRLRTGKASNSLPWSLHANHKDV